MFKLIGAVIVYGLALYGLVEGIDKLGSLMDSKKRPASGSEPDPEALRETIKRYETGDFSKPASPGAAGPTSPSGDA